MRDRVVLAVAAASLCALTACGGTTDGSARESAPVPSAAVSTISTVSTPTVTTETVTVEATAEPRVDDRTTVDGSATPASPSTTQISCPGPVNRGTGASAFEGTWQRHASRLILERDTSTSTLSMGASAVDTENWRVDWAHDECDSRYITVTLLERTALYGDGVGGNLFEGKTFRATFGSGANNTTVLITDGIGDVPGGELTWCKSGESVPECGA